MPGGGGDAVWTTPRRGRPAGFAVFRRAADLREVIGFSSFGVLVYYAIANAAAFTQPAADHRRPRGLHLLGVAGCLVLVVTLPWRSVLAGVVMFAFGLAGRWLILRRRTSVQSPPVRRELRTFVLL